MKKWIFSILCYLMALALPIYTSIVVNLRDEDFIFLTMVFMSSIAPALMFIILGIISQPRK